MLTVFVSTCLFPWALSGCGEEQEVRSTAHVGSRDCDVILEATADPATKTACDRCAGISCPADGCADYPCVEGAHVIQGCEEDGDCADFDGALCGRYSAPDNICSFHPDDL